MELWSLTPKDPARPWRIFLAASIASMMANSLGALPVIFALFALSDYMRLKAKGIYQQDRLSHYLFFQYLLPLAYHSGWLRAKLYGKDSIDRRDVEAVRRYVEKQEGR